MAGLAAIPIADIMTIYIPTRTILVIILNDQVANKIETPSGQLVIVKSTYSAGFESNWLYADRAQLIYPSKGVMTLQTRTGALVIPPLRGCWLPASELYCFQSASCLEIHSVFCRGLVDLLPDECAIIPVSPLMRELILALAGSDDSCHSPLDRMTMILTGQMKVQSQSPLYLPRVTSDKLRQIADALRRDPANSRTLEGWAALHATTGRSLARAFAREAGMSFTEFRRQIRLHAAMERLAEGQSVTSVPYDVGFSSAATFIAMFRRATGMTPKAYFSNRFSSD